MATDDLNKCLLVATTPSLGARLWIEPDRTHTSDMVCLQTGHEGGRGAARYLVVLPVRRTSASQVEPVLRPSEFKGASRKDPAGLWRLHLRKPSLTLPTPYSCRYSRLEWDTLRRQEPWVLVLALFANPRVTQPSDGHYTDDDVVTALDAFFGQQPQPEHLMRRGLVYLAPADLPGLPPSPAPAAVSAPHPASGGAEPALPTFTFALASCQYPAGLVDGTPQAYGLRAPMPPGPADASMLRLAARLDEPDDTRRPSLLVLTGDQIYADATAGLFDPRAGGVPAAHSSIRDAEDWLRVPYQNWYGSVGAQSVLGRLRTLMMLDDHEVDNNWEPIAVPQPPGNADRLERQKRLTLLMQAGSLGYQRYQRDLRDGALLPRLWHQRLHRGIAFFMADTRTERSPRHAKMDPLEPTLMNGCQTGALLAWMAQAPAQPAFVVSPSMLLPRRRSSQRSLRAALHSDAWDGYPGSLRRLLVRLWKIGRSNLVFLSGDEHLSSVVRATVTRLDVPGRAVTLHSVHSSGLYAPYPFANAVPELFALPDDWDFADPDLPCDRYRCVVERCGDWAPGDGFALLTLSPPADPAAGGCRQLEVQFDRATAARSVACTVSLEPGPGPYQAPSG